MVTLQNYTFMKFWEHNPFVWAPESEEENLHIGKHPVLAMLHGIKHLTPRRAGW